MGWEIICYALSEKCILLHLVRYFSLHAPHVTAFGVLHNNYYCSYEPPCSWQLFIGSVHTAFLNRTVRWVVPEVLPQTTICISPGTQRAQCYSENIYTVSCHFIFVAALIYSIHIYLASNVLELSFLLCQQCSCICCFFHVWCTITWHCQN